MAASTERSRPARRLIGLAAALVALGAASGAAAQVVVMEPVSGFYDWRYRGEFASTYQGDATVDAGGAFSALRFEARAGAGGPMSQNVRLFMDVAYAHTGYDFGNPVPVGCANPAACFTGAPWGDVHTVDFSPGASLVLNETIHFQTIVPIRWQAEGDNGQTGLTAGVIGMVRLRLSDSFTTGLGVGVQSELADDTLVFPVIALDWRITDGVRLVTRGGPYQGAEADLLFGPSDRVQLEVGVGWERQRFRMANRFPNPDGVGQYEAIPILAGFRLNLGRRAHLHLEGGVAVNGRLRIENSFGLLLAASDFDSAGLVRGGFRIDL